MQSGVVHERGFAEVRSSLMSDSSAQAGNLDYAPLVAELRANFATGKSLPYEWRVKELNQLRRMLVECQDKIMSAVQADLKRHPQEAFLELSGAVAEIDHTLAHLKEWMADEWVPHPLMFQPGRSKVVKQPLGVGLIIAPFNYPTFLAVSPLIGAVAAGCAAVIKPSELTPASARAIEEMVNQYLDPAFYRVVQGSVPETTALLKERWDHIFYTGNGAVARIVAAAAAKHLTPVTLELGGKSPVYVAEDAKIDVACKRIVSTKFLNDGQTCIAPDHVFVHNRIKDQFVSTLVSTVKQMYGADPSKSPDLARLVHPRHFDRLKSILDEGHGGKVVVGNIATADRDQKYIPPTVVVDPSLASRMMTEELFGPVLPVVGVDSMEQAIAIINGREHALASYVFTETKDKADKFIRSTMAGGACINDCVMHISNPDLPFGGVGPSGMGAYHGKASFDTYTHRRSVMERDTWLDNADRYPPYKPGTVDVLRRVIIGPLIPPHVKLGLQIGAAGLVAAALLRPRL